MTKRQLLAFITRRNRSDFNSNMQFHSDAQDSGFKVADLGEPAKLSHRGYTAYIWTTPHGRLAEYVGVLYLEGEPGSAEVFDKFKVAA